MGDEDKKKERGVADIVPIKLEKNKEAGHPKNFREAIQKMNLPVPRQKEPSLPEPARKDGSEIAQNQGKKKSTIS